MPFRSSCCRPRCVGVLRRFRPHPTKAAAGRPSHHRHGRAAGPASVTAGADRVRDRSTPVGRARTSSVDGDISMARNVYAGAEARRRRDGTALRIRRPALMRAGRLAPGCDRKEGRRVSIANALWARRNSRQKGLPRPGSGSHSGAAPGGDLVAETRQAIANLNRWAEEQTDGRIKGILPAANINTAPAGADQRRYSRRDWLRPFQAAQTGPGPSARAAAAPHVPMLLQRVMVDLLETPPSRGRRGGAAVTGRAQRPRAGRSVPKEPAPDTIRAPPLLGALIGRRERDEGARGRTWNHGRFVPKL